MKKMYVQPEIEITRIVSESFLSASGENISSDFMQDKITDQNQILSKEHKFDVWDTED